MDFEKALQELDLHPHQVKVYATLLQMGSSNIQEIAAKSEIKRTTAYSILDSLVQKGLVTYAQKGIHRQYSVENPKKIPALLEEKKRKIEEALPELISFYNIKSAKPIIRTYEGLEGIKRGFEETIDLKSGEETLVYSSYGTLNLYSVNKFLREYIKDYIRRRAERGITQRCIAEDSPDARELKSNDKKDLRITRLVNREKFPFSNQIVIFRNKMFIASYRDLLGVIIESTEIAKTQRAIFELAWIGAERYKTI